MKDERNLLRQAVENRKHQLSRRLLSLKDYENKADVLQNMTLTELEKEWASAKKMNEDQIS